MWKIHLLLKTQLQVCCVSILSITPLMSVMIYMIYAGKIPTDHRGNKVWLFHFLRHGTYPQLFLLRSCTFVIFSDDVYYHLAVCLYTNKIWLIETEKSGTQQPCGQDHRLQHLCWPLPSLGDASSPLGMTNWLDSFFTFLKLNGPVVNLVFVSCWDISHIAPNAIC